MGAIPVEFDIFQQQKRQIEHKEKEQTNSLEFTSEIISEKLSVIWNSAVKFHIFTKKMQKLEQDSGSGGNDNKGDGTRLGKS